MTTVVAIVSVVALLVAVQAWFQAYAANRRIDHERPIVEWSENHAKDDSDFVERELRAGNSLPPGTYTTTRTIHL